MIKNRQEILFLYDVTDANPNGDPLDENKPRIDEETGINIVTDVRLKRTIRDYLYDYKGFNGTNMKDIFVREVKADAGGLKDGKARAKDFGENIDSILENAIDIRMFGGVIPLEKASITFTGPVQFNMGRSLNKVALKHIKGTGAFAASEGKQKKTFREEYILPYSIINFYGIVNENAAKSTKLTDNDVDLMLDAMWNGTKNLITRSKMGHMPRLLLRVVYKEGNNYFIGGLHKKINLSSTLPDEKIRGIGDYSIDMSELITELKNNKEKIEKLTYTIDKDFNLLNNNEKYNFDTFSFVETQEIKL